MPGLPLLLQVGVDRPVLEGLAFTAATQVNHTANAAASTTHDSFSLFHIDMPEEAEKGLHRFNLKTAELDRTIIY